MNRITASFIIVSAFAATAVSALSAPLASCAMPTTRTTATKSAKVAVKPVQVAEAPKDVKCSVTATDIGAPSQAFNSSVYKGHTYYFCCSSCKPEFDADPTKYAKPAYAYPLVAPAKPAAPVKTAAATSTK